MKTYYGFIGAELTIATSNIKAADCERFRTFLQYCVANAIGPVTPPKYAFSEDVTRKICWALARMYTNAYPNLGLDTKELGDDLFKNYIVYPVGETNAIECYITSLTDLQRHTQWLYSIYLTSLQTEAKEQEKQKQNQNQNQNQTNEEKKMGNIGA